MVNVIFFYHQKRSVKLDKVTGGRWKITSCFCANARKLILGSIGTPLDHLKVFMEQIRYSCSHISGHHEPIHVNLVFQGFSSCSTEIRSWKCRNAKMKIWWRHTSVLVVLQWWQASKHFANPWKSIWFDNIESMWSIWIQFSYLVSKRSIFSWL